MEALLKIRVGIVETLLAAEANPKLIDDESWTTLRYSLFCSHPRILTKIINAGANPDAVSDEDGNTVLILAVLGFYRDNVKELLDAGANPDLTNYAGRTAADYALRAAEEGRYENYSSSGASRRVRINDEMYQMLKEASEARKQKLALKQLIKR